MKKKLLIILLLATISIICAVLFVAYNNGNNTKKDTYSITLSHDDTETPLVKINTTPEKNLFFINLQDYFVWRDPQTANQAYAKQMDIAVDPTAILPNPYGRIQPSGTVFDVDESLLYKDFSLGKNPENVSFTLHKLDGVNFENAEVRIWNTVMEPDENGVYTIDQAPIYYKSTEKIQNELSITAYRIFLSGVDYSACEDLFVLTIDNQNKEQAAVYNRSGGYYFDENIIFTSYRSFI